MGWPTWITLGATVVNAIAVVILVWVTNSYAKSSQRQAEAAELQAKASEAAATAAAAQARAAQAQANAATETLVALRQQMYDQDLVAHNVVELAIKSSLSNIEFWQQQISGSFALAVQTHGLPTPIILTPSNSVDVVDFAGRLSPELAARMNAAFDELNVATQRIEGLSRINERGLTYVDLPKEARELGAVLSHAKETLQRCQTDLYTAPHKDKFAIGGQISGI